MSEDYNNSASSAVLPALCEIDFSDAFSASFPNKSSTAVLPRERRTNDLGQLMTIYAGFRKPENIKGNPTLYLYNDYKQGWCRVVNSKDVRKMTRAEVELLENPKHYILIGPTLTMADRSQLYELYKAKRQ